MIGQQISHYKVTAKLGAGGMGEVYRARDTKLGRDVALKVLPESFAADAHRMARFQREAQMLASLNHPNIAAIYGLEASGATNALVMELVEGPTLAERIADAPIPVPEALLLARQIAEALEYAHEKGIIHRDLKPANIKLTADGHAKVLDFGLAKALAEDSVVQDISSSPTLSVAATKAGFILGTAAYMAPEQAKGKSVDRRADVWAFGCVLYEMLTGARPFPGDDVSETLAAVIRGEPDWTVLPVGTPTQIRKLLQRSLEKDLKRRLQAIGEARFAIEEYVANPAAASAFWGTAAAAPATGRSARGIFPWAIAGALAIATVTMSVLTVRSFRDAKRVLQLDIAPPEGTEFAVQSTSPGPVAVSPDGQMLAFAASDKSNKVSLYLRRLDTGAAQALTDTGGAAYPFWSPDSRWIGFFSNGKLKKIEVAGGPPVTLCDGPNGKGGAWNRDGVILFSPTSNAPIHRVSAAGGTATPITQFNKERGDNSHRHPRFLPDGRHYLYLARGISEHSVVAASLDGGPEKVVMKGNAGAAYVSGHLLYLRESTLMAQPFDAGSLEFKGDPIPVAEKIMVLPAGSAAGVFSASENGVLAYATGSLAELTTLEWVDRKGTKLGTLGDGADYREVALSPNGERAAVTIADPASGMWDIWVYEIKRNLRTRFTFDPQVEQAPAWSPDSKRLVFGSGRKGNPNLHTKPVTGTGAEEAVLESPDTKLPTSWSPDGKFVAYTVWPTTSSNDIWVQPMTGEGKPFALVHTQFDENYAQFSPDGKWVAYTSNESGRYEVYAVSFPNTTRKFQVSLNGGARSRWSRGGREIIYQTAEGTLMSVDVTPRTDTVEFGSPKPLFDAVVGSQLLYAPTPDAQRFLVISYGSRRPNHPVQLIFNWPELLNRRR